MVLFHEPLDEFYMFSVDSPVETHLVVGKWIQPLNEGKMAFLAGDLKRGHFLSVGFGNVDQGEKVLSE
jgi:hypothetical protein